MFSLVLKAVDDGLDYLSAFHYNANLIIWDNYKKVYLYCGTVAFFFFLNLKK